MALFARVPADGSYWRDLLPAFITNGIAIGLVYVATQVGAQMGVRASDAGVASGLIQTTGNAGGAVAIAIATTLAATSTHTFTADHPRAAAPVAITHGFHTAFLVFAVVSLAGAALSALVLGRRPTDEDVPESEAMLVA